MRSEVALYSTAAPTRKISCCEKGKKCTDPHYGEPPGSVSAWRDGDPDPHGEMRIRIRMELLAELDKDPYNNR